MEKEIIDFNIDTISKILMYLKKYHVIAEMYLLYLLLGQLSGVDVYIYNPTWDTKKKKPK